MSDPHPLVVQARQAFHAGDLMGARRAAESRLSTVPLDIDALEVRALILRRQGDDNAAIETLRGVIAVAPYADWAYADLTMLLHSRGERGHAEAVAHAGLAANPNHADLHNLLGAMRSEIDDLPRGETHFRRAVAIAGPHPDALRNLAINLTRQGRLDEADLLFAQAQRDAPGDAAIAAHWARLHELRGDTERALSLLDLAERLGMDVRLQRVITLMRAGRDEAALALLEASRGELGGDALLVRGRILDRLGRYAEAWSAFVAGKAKLAARDGARYDAAGTAQEFAELKRAFSAAPRHNAPARTTAEPIFIMGFPRSGTTMVEQILSSHSNVRAGGELPFAAEIAAGNEREPHLMRAHYMRRAQDYGLIGDARSFTDKMPLNEIWAPLIIAAFPTAPLIEVQRHPLDVCVSMMAHHMTHGSHCAYSIGDIARHMLAVDDLVGHYRAHCGFAPLVLRYESLVTDQEKETRRLLNGVALPFEAACLAFHRNARHAPTPSYAQVTEPLNDRSIGRWRQYATALGPAIEALAPLIAARGYDL